MKPTNDETPDCLEPREGATSDGGQASRLRLDHGVDGDIPKDIGRLKNSHCRRLVKGCMDDDSGCSVDNSLREPSETIGCGGVVDHEPVDGIDFND